MALDLEKIDLGGFGINQQEDQPDVKMQPIELDQSNMLDENQARSNMGEAFKIDPANHSKEKQLGNAAGMPSAAVATDPTSVESKLKLDNIDFDGMSKRSPNTAGYFTDFDNAVISQNDIGIMEDIESSIAQQVGDVARAFPAGLVDMAGMTLEGTSRIADSLTFLAAEAADFLLPDSADPYIWNQENTPDLVKNINEVLTELSPIEHTRFAGQQTKTLASMIGPPVDRQNTATQISGAVGQVLGQIVATVVAPWSANLMMFAQGSDQQGEAQEATGTEGTSVASSIAVLDSGAVTAMLERLGIDRLLDRIPPSIKNDMLRNLTDIGIAGGYEALQEVTENISQKLIELISTNPDAEVFEGLDEAATVGFGAGSIVRTLLNFLTPGRIRAGAADKDATDNASQLESELQTLDAIDDGAQNSQTNEIDPAAFGQMVEAADGDNDTNVYVDGAQVEIYLQGISEDEIQNNRALFEMAEQSQDAAALGGDVIISVGEFGEGVAGTEHYIALRPHMVLSPETISEAKQEQAQIDTRQYVEDMVAEAEAHVSEYVEAQEIFETVRDQMVDTGRMSPTEANMAAKLMPAWATVYADQHGMTVAEAYQTAGLTIEGPFTGERARLDAAVLTQAKDSGYEGDTVVEAREWQDAVDKGLDMSQDARMQRAQEMGFDPSNIRSVNAAFDPDFKDSADLLAQAPAIEQTETPQFKAWSGDGDVVESEDVNGHIFTAGTPVVLKVFHGTTHDFSVFDATRGNLEGQFGAINYFTSSEQDASDNYAGEGPDLTNRIEQRVEELQRDIDVHSFTGDVDALLAEFEGITAEDAALIVAEGSEVDLVDETTGRIADTMARKELSGGEEQTMELFVKVENPFVIGENAEWIEFIDNESVQTQAIEQVADNEGLSVEEVNANLEEHEDAIDEARWEIEADTENPLVAAIEAVASRNDVDASTLASEIYELGTEATPESIEQLLRGNDEFSYAEDPETGTLIHSQLIAEVIQELGFDSIILRNAEARFSNMNIEQDTAHVHVFDSNKTNIKSVDNQGTFDPADPDIFKQGISVKDLQSQLESEFDGVELSIGESNGVVTVSKIVVPEDQRNVGTGSAIIQRVTDWADQNSKTVALTPSKDFGGTVGRLKKFYKQLGFVENKGKNKNFEVSESMLREPDTSLAQKDTTTGVRGYYDPTNSIIRLTESSDLSTFLHEFAHFMYEMELKAGSDTAEGIQKWFRRNADDVAMEANKYLGDKRDVVEQSVDAFKDVTLSSVSIDRVIADPAGTGSPWLLPDGTILDTGGDHIELSEQLGIEGYTKTIHDTGALRVGFNVDPEGKESFVLVHAGVGVPVSQSQIDIIEKFVESTDAVIMFGEVAADAGDFELPSTEFLSLGEFKSKITTGEMTPRQPATPPTGKAGSITAADVNTYLDNGTTGDASKDSAIRRATHEQFARGFEEYLLEGKAPSVELRNAFATFARWLGQIYGRLRGQLNVNLDDEVREIMDRLLATEEQIAAAEGRARIEPLFTDAAMAGMTPQEFDDYQAQQVKTKNKQSETLRDKLIKQFTRQTEKWWKEEKADIFDEEMARLKTEQVYAAADRLKNGDIKLDLAVTKMMVGEQKVDKIGRESTVVPARLRGMTAPGQKGVHPDQAAEFFGYSSGSEMINDLMTAPPIAEVADANAQAEMIVRNGDILTDGTIEQQADDAIQNEERGKLILRELKVLSRGANQAALDRATIKTVAAEQIGQLSFRDIHPGKYRKAEIKAAQAAAVAVAAGDTEGARIAKQQQAVNFYLGMAATEAKSDTVKIVERTARYSKKAVRENIAKAGNGYIEQIDKILERFDFRKSATLASVDRVNENINLWMKNRIEQDGDALVLTAEILDTGYVTHWKNVPYDALKGIDASLKNMEHVARYSNKMKVEGEEHDFQTLVANWTEHMAKQDARYPTKNSRSRADDARDATMGEKVQKWAAQLTKIPFLASWLDGGERAGMSSEILTHGFTDALFDKLRMMQDIALPISELIEGRSTEDKIRHKQLIWIPEINDNLYGHQIVAVALNTGNAGNLKKMLLGEGWADPDVEADISIDNPKLQAILTHASMSDMKMVQTIWDQMDTLYPQLAEVHRKTTGLVPPKVEATPYTIEVDGEAVEMKGGYYPVKYSPKRGHKAEKNQDKQDAEVDSKFHNASSIQASVNTGTTNERTGFYAPVKLNLDVVNEHFHEVIHYITHHDQVRQVNKLINNQSVQDAITASVGEADFKLLAPWLNDIAKDGRAAPVKNYIDEIFNKLRFGVTLGVMGFKASTGIMQFFGLFTTASEVGVGPTVKAIYTVIGKAWYMQALQKSLGSQEDMQSTWQFALERSKVMEHRVQTMDREISNAMNRLKGKSGFLPAVQEASMKHIALIQTYMVDLPTWMAMYDKTRSETGDDVKAVRAADWAVENLQGSGATKDMAALLRNQSKLTTTFTMFMTFFSSLGNLGIDLKKGVQSGKLSYTDVAAMSMFLYTLPVFFEMLMRGELAAPEDEEDDDRLAQFMLKLAMYPTTSLPVIRDITSAVLSDYGYSASPPAAMLERGLQAFKSIGEATFTDKEVTQSQIKNASKLTFAFLGVPGVSQTWASFEHVQQVMEDGEEFAIREFLFGPDR